MKRRHHTIYGPLVIFTLFGAYLALSYYRSRQWKKLVDVPLLMFGTVSLLPAAIYYGYGIVFAGFMRWKVSTSFMPYLLSKVGLWQGWLNNVVDVAELAPLPLAVCGFFLLRQKRTQYIVVGLAAGFLLFSIAFTYHIHTLLWAAAHLQRRFWRRPVASPD